MDDWYVIQGGFLSSPLGTWIKRKTTRYHSTLTMPDQLILKTGTLAPNLLLRCPILMIQQTILLIVSSKCILKEFKAAFLTPINLLQPPAIVSPPLKQTGDSPTSVIFENCSYLTTVTTNPSWRMNLPPSPSLSGSWRTLMDNCGNNALCTLYRVPFSRFWSFYFGQLHTGRMFHGQVMEGNCIYLYS